MPFSVFDGIFNTLGGYDAYYITASWGSGPTPPPTPPPTPATLTSITVTPANASVVVGSVTQFRATGKYSDGTTKDITASVSWVSSKPALATVSTSGLVRTIAAGSLTISAISVGITGSTVLVVSAPTPPPTPPPTPVAHTIRVQDSTDGGVNWNTIFQQNLSTKK
jgi:uncharacterized protein YjdB